MKPAARNLALLLIGLAPPLGAGLALPARAGAMDLSLNEQLQQRHAQATREHQEAYQRIVQRVNAQLGIDYQALDNVFGPAYREYQQKQELIGHVADAGQRRGQHTELNAFFRTPEAAQYLSAKVLVENELDRDHLLQARRLQACEEILDTLTKADPMFASFFHAPAYQQRYGLLLKRVAAGLPEGVSASTRPLDAYTMFTDRTRMPVIITISPATFQSLAYLRSILVHELNHVLLYKTPLSAELEQDPAAAVSAAPLPLAPLSAGLAANPYTQLFSKQHAGSAQYQYHLLHEYSSFSAQLMYDDRVPDDPLYRLAPADRQNIERLRQWAFTQLSSRHKAFVAAHSIPPIAPAIAARFPASGPSAPASR